MNPARELGTSEQGSRARLIIRNSNLQFAANKVYAPRQFAPASGNQRDIFEEVIKNTIPELFRFVDDWDLYHCGVGEVHCGTAEKRVLPQNKWWTTLP